MTAGRRRTPDKVKLLKGTHRKDRASVAPSVQSTGELSPPSWLSSDAVPYFESIKAEAAELGLNSRTYSYIAGYLAECHAEIQRCNELIAENGTVLETTGDKGQRMFKTNPAVSQKNEARKRAQSLCSEFGFTPTAINRIGKPKGKNEKQQGFGSL